MKNWTMWLVVLVIIVIAGGVAYAYHARTSEQGEMHEEGAMMQENVGATSSDAMMHEATDTMMASSSDSMHEEGTMMAH